MRLLLFFLLMVSSAGLLAQSDGERFKVINSPYDEQNPVLSPDGHTLFLTIGNHPENVGGIKDPGDIWLSRKLDQSQWSDPVHGGSLINDKAYNAVAGFSPDGLQLFLHGHYAQGGVARTQGISVSRSKGAGWSRPENMNIPYFLNKSGSLLSGTLSDDNSVFVFSAESYGSYGVDDIYISVKERGTWSEPRNLGTTINTRFQELSPSLSADLKTLYFSSNGRKGFGSFDIYSATRLDGTWKNWSEPRNLGGDINSEGRELFYRFYAAVGFAIYTTTKSSDGYGDLRVYTPREPLPRHDTVIYASLEDRGTPDQTTSPLENAESPAVRDSVIEEQTKREEGEEVRVYGSIRNATTGEPVTAKLSFEGPSIAPRSVQSGKAGYVLGVPPSVYKVRIEASGYISSLESLHVRADDLQELELNFNLQPVEVGTMVSLKDVLFAQAKTDILPESFPELDLVVRFLEQNPRVKIELMGHTDGRGGHADNVRLSQQRVNKVKEYLVSKGIESRRISGKGFGGSKPIASNDTEESRRMNRRVEFVIKKF